MADIYIVGMSNTQALIEALPLYKRDIIIEIDNLNSRTDGQWYTDGKNLNPEYFNERLNSKLVVAMLYGNWYNSLALIQHPIPFDFEFPGVDTSVDVSMTTIPFSQIYRKFSNCIRNQMKMLVSLRKMTPGRLVFMEPPPPYCF